MGVDVIIGNICSIGAMLCDSFSGTRKNKKAMLLAQSCSQIFYIMSSIVLKGYSATVQNVVAIFRNTFYAFNKKNKILEIIFLITPVILGFVFNNRGIIGILPIVANLEYSVCLFVINDPDKLKVAFVISNIMFCIFNFYILNYIGGIFCVIIIATSIISLIKKIKKE